MAKYRKLLFLVLVIIITGCGAQNGPVDNEKAIETTKEFILECFNDDKINEADYRKFIGEDSRLGEFIDDRKEINKKIYPYLNADRQLVEFKIDEISWSLVKGHGLAIAKCNRTFTENGETFTQPVFYNVGLDRNNKIVMAYSTDPSSLILIGANRGEDKYYEHDWMVDKRAEKPYDLETKMAMVSDFTDDSLVVDEETFQTIERLVLGFIFDVFSDYRVNNGDVYNYTDNPALIDFIDDRRAFYKAHYEKLGQEIISKYNVNYDIKLDYYTDNIKLAYVAVDHEFLNGGDLVNPKILYLAVVDIRGPKILACLSNEPLSDKLLGTSHEDFNSLDLNWQLNQNIKKPYNLDEKTRTDKLINKSNIFLRYKKAPFMVLLSCDFIISRV